MANTGVLQTDLGGYNAASGLLAEAARVQSEGHARTDAGERQRRLTDNFQTRLMPQLRSADAAAGQFYSTARRKDEVNAGKDYLGSSFEIQSALQRQLDDFTRQRWYATVGAMV